MEGIAAYSTILLATDGSKESRNASGHALYLAKAVGARLCVLNVVDTHNTQSLGVHYSEAVHELRKDGEAIVNAVVEAAQAEGVKAEALLADGHPGRAIIQASTDQKADLIIMGATGKSGLREMLLGSVSDFVADNARCPVLIVRA